MNLNKSLRALIIDRFKTGASITEISAWYNQKPEKIEEVIRKALIVAEGELIRQAVRAEKPKIKDFDNQQDYAKAYEEWQNKWLITDAA